MFPMKAQPGGKPIVVGGNPQLPGLNDSPVRTHIISDWFFSYTKDMKRKYDTVAIPKNVSIENKLMKYTFVSVFKMIKT